MKRIFVVLNIFWIHVSSRTFVVDFFLLHCACKHCFESSKDSCCRPRLVELNNNFNINRPIGRLIEKLSSRAWSPYCLLLQSLSQFTDMSCKHNIPKSNPIDKLKKFPKYPDQWHKRKRTKKVFGWKTRDEAKSEKLFCKNNSVTKFNKKVFPLFFSLLTFMVIPQNLCSFRTSPRIRRRRTREPKERKLKIKTQTL